MTCKYEWAQQSFSPLYPQRQGQGQDLQSNSNTSLFQKKKNSDKSKETSTLKFTGKSWYFIF